MDEDEPKLHLLSQPENMARQNPYAPVVIWLTVLFVLRSHNFTTPSRPWLQTVHVALYYFLKEQPKLPNRPDETWISWHWHYFQHSFFVRVGIKNWSPAFQVPHLEVAWGVPAWRAREQQNELPLSSKCQKCVHPEIRTVPVPSFAGARLKHTACSPAAWPRSVCSELGAVAIVRRGISPWFVTILSFTQGVYT